MIFFLLLTMSLTAYRLTRLVIKDTLPPVLWTRDRLVGGWREPTEGEWRAIRSSGTDMNARITVVDGVTMIWAHRAAWVPDWLAELLSCPWCASGWIAGGVTAATDVWIGVPVPVLTGFAVWAVAAVLTSRESL